ncbi:hypothetical protein G6F22_020968 [Rhizopus arrhizus]|nr:hypothetical protein G6F22_020968 [Rhizopus arrhizus]
MARLCMQEDADPFDHPAVPEGHPLRRHVLYRLGQAQWRLQEKGDADAQGKFEVGPRAGVSFEERSSCCRRDARQPSTGFPSNARRRRKRGAGACRSRLRCRHPAGAFFGGTTHADRDRHACLVPIDR